MEVGGQSNYVQSKINSPSEIYFWKLFDSKMSLPQLSLFAFEIQI